MTPPCLIVRDAAGRLVAVASPVDETAARISRREHELLSRTVTEATPDEARAAWRAEREANGDDRL